MCRIVLHLSLSYFFFFCLFAAEVQIFFSVIAQYERVQNYQLVPLLSMSEYKIINLCHCSTWASTKLSTCATAQHGRVQNYQLVPLLNMGEYKIINLCHCSTWASTELSSFCCATEQVQIYEVPVVTRLRTIWYRQAIADC